MRRGRLFHSDTELGVGNIHQQSLRFGPADHPHAGLPENSRIKRTRSALSAVRNAVSRTDSADTGAARSLSKRKIARPYPQIGP
jgi:hypothetical protein